MWETRLVHVRSPLILWESTLDPGSPADLGCSCVVRRPPGFSGHCHILIPTQAELPTIVCLFLSHHYSPAATHPYRSTCSRSPRALLPITSFSGQLFHRYTQLSTLPIIKMDPKYIPPPHGKIECLGDFMGPEVLIMVGHGGDCATFHLAEGYLHGMGTRWRALRGKRANRISRGLFGGLFSGIFGRKFGGVFRSPFAETPGLDKNPRILNLKGDYPDAIRIILQIGTHEFPKLPKKLDFPDLVRLAEAAARWDSHALLAPFIDEWVAPWRARMFNPRYEQWLYIAHEFGWEEDYLKLSRHLATHCSVDAQDRLLALDGTVLEHRGKFPFDTLCKPFERGKKYSS